jgi:methionine sulfoxide reductase heme-binding subunit
MSAGFQAILWNRQKKWYDIIFVSIVLIYLVSYFTINIIFYPSITFETMLIRSFGTLAIIMLHVILSIGPLARVNKKFLVLLYNRRHLGVTMFLVASVHALFSIFQFHANGNINPILSIFVSNTHYNSFIYFPFQTLGFVAYIILVLMAFTSHDFWLSVLTPKIWKTLHIFIYLAYLLLILHILLGIVQLENAPVYFLMLLLGVLWLAVIHMYAGYKEYNFDEKKNVANEGWVKVCNIDEIEDSKAKMIFANGERIAIFKYDNKLSAVHNVCKHQNGPLGEGKIVDGCITCPWHGYQYEPANGCAPAPFTEKIATYYTMINGNEVWLNPSPLPEGTFVEPTILSNKINLTSQQSSSESPFYIGWQPIANKIFSLFAKKISVLIVCITLLSAILISVNQSHIAASQFIFDDTKEYAGQLILKPFPALRTVTGKDVYGNPIIKTYPLINASKFGADSLVKNILTNADAADVVLKGDILTRDSVEEIVLDYGLSSIQIKNKTSSLDLVKIQNGKDTIINGEIIDPKCYFGAMNPGEGKPHRSCAIRCIEGGIMPMVNYKNNAGKNEYAVLLGENGENLNKVIAYAVAEPVQLKGKLYILDNWKILQVKIPDGLIRTTLK